MTPVEPVCQPIAGILTRTELAPPQSCGALALWPLCLREGEEPAPGAPYAPLGHALAAGTLRVDEVHEGGEVPHVRVANAGELAVLVLFGEELRGAKQNRVANASFLVPGNSEVVLDVSCVEAGRWHRRPGERFGASDELISQALRKKIAGRVAAERMRGARFSADQGEVWQEIGERLRRTRTSSRTSAYADYRAGRERDLRALSGAFRALPRQVGFVAAIAGEVSGLEAIGRPEVFAADFQALLGAYAIDAVDAGLVRDLETQAGGGAARFVEPEPFLDALAGAAATRTRSLGAGDDLRLSGSGVSGCALVDGELVHLTAFPG